MGNYTSCCLLQQDSRPQTAKLLDVRGNLRRVKVPVTAAELMLGEPGHVVSPIDELRRTGRLLALPADGELTAGRVYLLVPLGRANSRVSGQEMAFIKSACRRRWLKCGRSKVLPAGTKEGREKGENQVRVLGGKDSGCPRQRPGNCRQWRPVLEPISEMA